jgi:hypothetical protein
LTAGKQGELVYDVSKEVVKFGGQAMMGRRSSKCARGGDGSATNFVRSFVLSLSRENQEKTKDRINSYLLIGRVSENRYFLILNIEVSGEN